MVEKLSTIVKHVRDNGLHGFAMKAAPHLIKQISIGRQFLFNRSWKEVQGRKQVETNLDDVLDTVLDVRPGYPPFQVAAMQLRDELRTLATRLESARPRSVLEIGTANGGSLYVWTRHLDSVNTIVSVDLPGGKFGGGYDDQKTRIFQSFAPSREMHFVRKDSHRRETFKEVSKFFDSGVDFLFIDGDHTYEGVKRDFNLYSQLVADGGIIALHDIVTHPDDPTVVKERRVSAEDIEERHLSWGDAHPDCNVDKFWEEVTDGHETEEIISHPKQTWAGIGIVWV